MDDDTVGTVYRFDMVEPIESHGNHCTPSGYVLQTTESAYLVGVLLGLGPVSEVGLIFLPRVIWTKEWVSIGLEKSIGRVYLVWTNWLTWACHKALTNMMGRACTDGT